MNIKHKHHSKEGIKINSTQVSKGDFMKIAIVGCGISGANTLKTIIDHKNFSENIHIDIFEKRNELGVGPAYEDDDMHKVLNTPVEHMNLNLENRDEFKNWLIEKYGKLPTVEGKIPRPIVGLYIKEKYKKYFAHKNVSIHQNEIVDVIKENDKFILKSKNESYGPYNEVFLSIGQSYYKDDYNLNEYENYVSNPYPLREKITNINKNDTLGIIGTGPSSIDIYRYLSKYFDYRKPLYFFTNSSFFALPEIKEYCPKNICSFDEAWISNHQDEDGFIKLDDFKETFDNDFKKACVDFYATYEYYKDNDIEVSRKSLKSKDFNLEFCQSYALELWYVSTSLFNSLNGLEQLEFKKSYQTKIAYLMTKTPFITMENIFSDLDKGKIKIVKDTEDISYINGKFEITTKNKESFSTDKIFNAQGFEKDLSKAIKKDNLLENLYKNRLIDADLNDNINVAYPSYNPITTKYGQIKNLHINGMWTASVDISNNDLRSVLISSKDMANNFMNNLEN